MGGVDAGSLGNLTETQAVGDPLELPVKLKKKQDTLQTLVPQWRPNIGPFKSHIVEVAEDGSQKTISPSLALR